MKNSFFLFLLFFSQWSSAQYAKGYVITPAQDTLFGLVHEKSGVTKKNSCLFKFYDGRKQVFSSKEIIKFYSAKTGFFSGQKIKDEFVQDIVIGKLSLYKTIGWKPRYLFEKDTLLLMPIFPNEDVVFSDNNKHVIKYDHKIPSTLVFLTQDCSQLQIPNSIKKNDFAVAEWVTKYNHCLDQDSKLVLPKSRSLMAHVFVKYENINIKTDFSFHEDQGQGIFKTIKTPYQKTVSSENFGLGLELSAPVITKDLFLQFEFTREKYFFEAGTANELTIGVKYNDYKLTQTYYHFPILLKVRLLRFPFEIYAEGGYSIAVNHFSESYLSQSLVANPPFQSSKSEGVQDVNYSKIYSGTIAGFSIEKKIMKGIALGGFYHFRTLRSGENIFSGGVTQNSIINSFGFYLKY